MQSQQTYLSCIRDRGDIPANVVDLREHLGGIPFERICFRFPVRQWFESVDPVFKPSHRTVGKK